MESKGMPGYLVDQPYPKVQACGPDRDAGRQMLDNVGGSNSEMSAVSLYFYNHILTAQQAEISEIFHKISIVEMHHLEIFGTLAMQLGEDPRLWTSRCGRMTWWTPGYHTYDKDLRGLLHIAAEGEKRAIEKYTRQCESIRDENIVANLRRVLLDERAHLRAFEYLLQTQRG